MGARRGTIGILLVATALVGGAVQVVRAVDGDDPPIAAPAVAAAPAVRVPSAGRSFTVVASGDILTENAVLSAAEREADPGERYDFAALFTPIASNVHGADLAICHMELPVGRPGEPPANLGKSAYGGNRLRGPYEVVVGVTATGFDRCSTASNHSNDTGTEGIVSTLDALDAVGLTHDGTARTPDEALPTAAIITVNGVRVAHLSYTRFSNTGAADPAWQLNAVNDPITIATDVQAVREAGAEVVIVSIHLGAEMATAPTAADRAFVESLTAAVPIDLVIQHGPHVIQPVERVNDTVVFWSVGNLISGMGVEGTGKYADRRTLDGLLATARFVETQPGRFIAEPSPVLICLDPATRVVWPAAALDDPATPAEIRPVLSTCLERSQAVVAGLA